jgi:flavin reductase (DIM6/NTAB) family NADH-FMN oxidoreductase RutF
MMNHTSASLGNDESEFDFANVERCASHNVAACSVKQAPVRYECTLRETISVSDLATGGTVVLLDVKCIYVQDDFYDIDENQQGAINQSLVDSVGKMGADFFSLTSDLVELKRP